MKTFFYFISLLISTSAFSQDTVVTNTKPHIELVGVQVSQSGSIGYYKNITGFKVGDNPHEIALTYFGKSLKPYLEGNELAMREYRIQHKFWLPSSIAGIGSCVAALTWPFVDSKALKVGCLVSFGTGLAITFISNAIRRKHICKAVYYYNNPQF